MYIVAGILTRPPLFLHCSSAVPLLSYGTSDDVVLPQDCDQGLWCVHDASKFVKEAAVTCALVTPNSVSEFIQELVVTQRIAADIEKESLAALVGSSSSTAQHSTVVV